ncbi:MAG: hypothetical protein PHG61_09305 [Candidatus Marinimicrobia bacterium]|nr:hypothetical protein [Candidatus Neomarinimicrobiota bacterium]
MRKNWLLLISMLILGLTVQSPAQPENPDEMGADMAARREKMEALRIYKMTEFLELTSEQAVQFFPKLKAYEDSVRQKQHQQMELIREIDLSTQQSDSTGIHFSTTDVQKYLRKIARIEKEIITEKEQFIENLSSILSPNQQLKYLVFDSRFRRRMLRSLKPPPPDMKK